MCKFIFIYCAINKMELGKTCFLCLKVTSSTFTFDFNSLERIRNNEKCVSSCVKILISYILRISPSSFCSRASASSANLEDREELQRNISSCLKHGRADICEECLSRGENLMNLHLDLEKIQMQILDVMRSLQDYLKAFIRAKIEDGGGGGDGELFRFQSVLREEFMSRQFSDGAQVRLQRLNSASNVHSSVLEPMEEDSRNCQISVSDCHIENELDCHDDDTNANYSDGEASSEDIKVLPSKSDAKPNKAANLPRQCDICYEDIPHRKLEDHLQAHPQFEKLYKCDICPENGAKRVYGSYKGLVWHYLQSKHNTQLPCKLCPDQDQAILFRGRDLCKHLYDFHKLDHPKLKCTFEDCSQEFCDPVSRATHRSYWHFPKHRGRTLQCSVCKATFKTWQGLQIHMKRHGKEHVQFPCQLCPEIFKDQMTLQKHKEDHRSEKEKAVKLRRICDICYEKIPHTKLEDHLRTHSQFEKIYKCDICSGSDDKLKRIYGSYKGLVWHYLQSSHKVMLPCNLCPDQAVLFRARDLCRHLYDFHQLDHPKLKCTFENCSEEFCDPTTRHAHRWYKHFPKHAGKKIECEICKKTFTSMQYLTVHMKRHKEKDEAKATQIASNTTPPRQSWKAANLLRMCDICYENIPHRRMEQHLQTHPQFEKLYKCDICPENDAKRVYGSFKGLVWHYLQSKYSKSQHKVQLPCKLCPDQEQDQTILFRLRDLCKHLYDFHQLSHPKLKCGFEDCSEEFCDPTSRNSHRVYRHFPKHRGRTLKCEVCQSTSKTWQGLQVHMQQAHGTKKHQRLPVSVSCETCAKVFREKATLRSHMKCHEEMVECPHCSKKLRPRGLQLHIKSAHGTDLVVDEEGRGVFLCDVCKKSFKSKLRLDSHIERIHTEGKGQIFVCDACPKRFKARNSLQTHKEAHHEAIDLVVCPHCPKQCTRFALDRHIKRAHGEKKFQCRFCPKTFTLRQSLKYHEEIHKNEKKYKCAECPYSSNTPTALRCHRVAAHVERTMKCSQCPMTFSDKQTLRKHERRGHRTERSFKCEHCPMTYFHRENLVCHKKRIHGIQTGTGTDPFPKENKVDEGK